MVRKVVGDGIIEQYDVAKSSKYWQRHKKQQVDYAYDTPFATDRQLEDQRLLQEKNRNPRALIPTKVEKVRSELLIAKQGQSRAIAVKANVVNKFVREASGAHSYAIVAPPRQKSKKSSTVELEKIDPDTHPAMAPYAKESTQKPVICSFGHRPRSASRTFHPATMKFRLRHNEVLKNTSGSSKCGLPVAILSKVLHAPRIQTEEERLADIERAEKESKASRDTIDYSDLFFTTEEQRSIFSSKSVPSEASGDRTMTLHTSRKKSMQKLQPIHSMLDRPDWDDAFYRIKVSHKERLALKESVMLKSEILPLEERMKRFAKKAAEVPRTMYCPEKQDLDKKMIRPEFREQHAPPKAVPVKKGYPLYTDPNEWRLLCVKDMKKEQDKINRQKMKAWKYQEQLASIPSSNYFPTSELVKMKKVTAKGNCSTESSQNEDETLPIMSSQTSEFVEETTTDWEDFEVGLRKAMKAAKKGDTNALYDFHMVDDENSGVSAKLYRRSD